MDNKRYKVMVVRPYSSGVIQEMLWEEIVDCVTKDSSGKMWDRIRMFPGDRNVVILFNDTCKFDNVPLNRVFIRNDGSVFDTIEGTFIIIGSNTTNEHYGSLTADQSKILCEVFSDWTKPVSVMSFGEDPSYAFLKRMMELKAQSKNN